MYVYYLYRNQGDFRDIHYRGISHGKVKSPFTASGIPGGFTQFSGRYLSELRAHRTNCIGKAQIYLHGLMKTNERRNIEQMASVVPDADYERLQWFISESPWSAQAVNDRTALIASELFGDETDAALLIDECSFQKKGTHSVGVDRQWLGSVGKVDNGQVGVYVALSNGNNVALINTRLYLPRSWTSDSARCKKAGVPDSEAKFLTKDNIAIELVKHARSLDVKYGYVVADAGYGKGSNVMEALETQGEIFMIDVHTSMQVYLNAPAPYVPEDTGSRGRKHTTLVSDLKPQRVDKIASSLPSSAWIRQTVRPSTKGPLVYEYAVTPVWIWSNESGQVYQWQLLMRRDIHGRNLKYSLTNSPAETPLLRLAKMQAQRYWIERAFEDAKQVCGMDEYEVRSWMGWHHHMALVMMAQLFIVQMRIENKHDVELLSSADVRRLMATVLPSKILDLEDVLDQMHKRHKVRQRQIDAAEVHYKSSD